MTFGLGFGFPRGRPSAPVAPVASLSYNFVDATALPASLTFTRNSNATQIDSLGRMAWAPVNLNAYTESFGGTGWTVVTSATATSNVDAPPGFTSSVELTTTVSNDGFSGSTVLNSYLIAGGSYVFTAWVKQISGGLSLRFFGGTSITTLFPTTSWTKISVFGFSDGTTPGVRLTLAGVTRIAGIQIEPAGPDSLVTPEAGVYYATSGTPYYGPRFDYNSFTFASRGLLIEQSGVNNLTSSDNAGIIAVNAAGSEILILGYNSTVEAFADGTSSVHALVSNSFTPLGSTVYTVSMFVRSVGAQFVQLATGINASLSTTYVNFDIFTGVITATGATASGTITRYNDDVFRITMTWTTVAVPTADSAVLLYFCTTGTDTRAPVNTSADGIRYFGMQHELGAFATSLIPTYGAALTRAEETCSTPTAGWLAPNAGAMFAQFSQPYVDSSATAHGVATTDGNARWIYTIQGAVRAFDGTNVRTGPAYTANTPIKAILALVGGNMRQSVNGGAVGVTTFDGTMTPNITLQIGSIFSSNTKLNGWVARIDYYPSALTDAQLQAFTA